MTEGQTSLISALICTRNRGPSLVETITSILANTHPNFELVIIDQSSNDETENAAKPFFGDNRLRYIRSTTVGKARALNLGLAETSGDVVAVTDDDCIVPQNWLETFARIFAEHPNVAVAFCNVEAAEHDASKGFVPDYVRESEKLVTTLREKCDARGIGAGLAIRRSMVLKIGGFDTALGPGGKFPDCEDGDVAVRALLAGYYIYETATVSVEHFGFRTWAEGRQLARRSFLGIGAAYSKPLKCGRWDFLIIPAHEFFRYALLPPILDILRLRRPYGLGRIIAFMQGFIGGLRTPVDKTTLRFVQDEPDNGASTTKLLKSH